MTALPALGHRCAPRGALACWVVGLMAVWALVDLAPPKAARGETPTIVTSYALRPSKRIEIAPQNQPLSEVIKDLMKQVDANYIFDPSAAEALAQPYTGEVKGITVDQALRSVLQTSSIDYIVWGTLTGEPGAPAKHRWTYTFFHIAAGPPKPPAGMVHGPPENQLAAAAALFARILATLAEPDGAMMDIETVPLEYVNAQQVVDLLQSFRTWGPRGPGAVGQQLYALGYLSRQLSPEGDEQLQRMEQVIAQKQQERDRAAQQKGADDPEVIRLDAELDDLRARHAAIEEQVANEIASVMRRIVPGGPLPVYMVPAGEGGDKVLLTGTREAIDRAKRAIAVIDQPPPQAELEAFAEIVLRVGPQQHRFNLSTGGPCRAGQTMVTTSQFSAIPGSTLDLKVTPRAATRDAVNMDMTWNLSASLPSERLGVPIEIKRYFQTSLVVPTGARAAVGRWQLTGDPDVTGTLTFYVAVRAGARPGTAGAPPIGR